MKVTVSVLQCVQTIEWTGVIGWLTVARYITAKTEGLFILYNSVITECVQYKIQIERHLEPWQLKLLFQDNTLAMVGSCQTYYGYTSKAINDVVQAHCYAYTLNKLVEH